MLICKKGSWQIESDGYLSAAELVELEDLRALDDERAKDAARDASRLAERVRAMKRRAWRRGYEAGRAAAVRDFVMPHAAASFVARCVEERLVRIAMDALVLIIGKLPPAAALPNQLRRCIAASRSQQVMSLRVSNVDYHEAKRLIARLEQELAAPLFTVLADAGLPPHSCIVETERGVIDGSLRMQLNALERGIRDAIDAMLGEYRGVDEAVDRQFAVLEQGLRDVIDAINVRAHGPENAPGAHVARDGDTH
ncbi:FliH/SctL family protein [Paraburkholderia rhizosphaerae]|uniref:Flagellar assembly protein FliH n=1 Tax=Paraburkholderia rhizosphaerae TaxID=480658 RepID=A0A4R8M243_9BURK|nr:FliH/SctL family protein [Paraburkholderia rhizosphaerae]TDY53571.1 type III secretion protein L [Paraburkholderia rhizosphaerae]